MSGLEMFMASVLLVAGYFEWKRFIYKNEQYTIVGWLGFAAVIGVTVAIGKALLSI
jgi:hypothetical protein